MNWEQLAKIREQSKSRLEPARQEVDDVIRTALGVLQHDLENPEQDQPNAMPDAFMLRANHIVAAFFDTGFFAAAERAYDLLAKVTCEYRERTGKKRHAGAMFANKAGACAAQGNLDQAVVELLRAAQDDVATYNVTEDQSFAITDLLEDYFSKPVRIAALQVAQKANPALVLTDLEWLRASLRLPEEAVFLAYARLVMRHDETNQRFPNTFSQLQVFLGLHGLSAMVEAHLKTLAGIAGDTTSTMLSAVEALYKAKQWWGQFDQARNHVGATRKSTSSYDDRLRKAIAIVPSDDISMFWKSLLLAYIVRNHTSHQVEAQCALVQDHSQEALGHILHVMTSASRHK